MKASRWPRWAGPAAVFAVVFALGLVLVVVPVIALLFWGPSTPGEAASVSVGASLSDPILRTRLWSSLVLATEVAVGAVLIGFPVGLHLATARSTRTTLLGILHVLPLCLPPYVTALAWADLLGTGGVLAQVLGPGGASAISGLLYSRIGCAMALIVALSPIVSLLTAAAIRASDPGLVEAGLLARRPGPVLARVVLPTAAPALALGALLVFLFTVGEVAVPQLLRVEVYSTLIFNRLADLSFQPGEALARALPLLVLAAVAAALLHAADRDARASQGLRLSATRPLPGAIGRVAALALGVAALVVTLPILLLVGRALGGRGGGWAAFAATLPALENTLVYALASATAMLAVAAPAGYLWSRASVPGGVVALPFLLGLVLPSAVLATGLMTVWNRPATLWVYRGDLIVVLAFSARYLFVPLRAAKLGFDRAPPQWDEAARLAQGSAWRRFVGVTARAQLPILAIAWLLGFLLSLRDLETIIPFYPPGGESLAIRTMTLEANSPPGLTAASATLQLLLAGAALGALVWLARRRREARA